MNLQKGDKVKVKKGAVVGQDFNFFRWEDEDLVFSFDGYISKERVSLKRYGFGYLAGTDYQGPHLHDAYGNGGIFVNEKDLMTADGDMIYKPTQRMLRPEKIKE